MSTQTLSLEKTLDLRKQKVLDLKKSAGIEGQFAKVKLVLDYSGSMANLYRDGDVQQLVERLLPIGMAFDDDGEVDVYLFHDGVIKIKETMNVKNINGFIDRAINGKKMGFTNYAPAINAVVKDSVAVTGTTEEKVKTGLFSSKKVVRNVYGKEDLPTYCIFITDGANDDKPETETTMIDVSYAPVFFQFVGIGSASFPFLEKLDDLKGRHIDNANFFTVPSLRSKSDDDLYKLLLTEFPSYIKEARSKGLIN